LFWAVTSLVAFSIAGEKMPWLTLHITLPAILCTAWGLGRVIDAVDWTPFRQPRAWLAALVTPAFLLSLFAVLGSLLGANPPFQGKSLDQLQATSGFLTT
jgi:predicted membrane-bound mannosyltransferase